MWDLHITPNDGAPACWGGGGGGGGAGGTIKTTQILFSHRKEARCIANILGPRN